MEQQSKKVFDRAMEMYHAEMNAIIADTATRGLETVKATQKRFEDELTSYLQKELAGYAKLPEVTKKFIVFP